MGTSLTAVKTLNSDWYSIKDTLLETEDLRGRNLVKVKCRAAMSLG